MEESWRESVERTDWSPGRWEEREVVASAWRAEVRALVASLLGLFELPGGNGETERDRFLWEEEEEERDAVVVVFVDAAVAVVVVPVVEFGSLVTVDDA